MSYGRDLKEAGYRWRDLLNVYVLNVLLISVNLAGVLRSLQQMLTGRRSPFVRTPKVDGRTASPATHIIVPALLLVTIVLSTVFNLWLGRWFYAAFFGGNAALLLYGMLTFVGARSALQDVRAGFDAAIRVPRTRSGAARLASVTISES